MLTSTRPNKCKHCRQRMPADKARHVIHEDCIQPWLAVQNAKKAAKAKKDATAARRVEKAVDRQRKEKLKTRREYLAEAQAILNRYVRLRDAAAGYGCISCGSMPSLRFGGAMDCGHFRSVGSAPHIRYLLWNMASQCVRCNQYLGGNAIEYRRGLVERRGLERVEAIEAMQGVAKFDIPYLKRLKAVFAKKTRRLEKRCSAV